MKVFYRAVRRTLLVYESIRVEFCCAAMRRQWGRLLGFGGKDAKASTSNEVNSYHNQPQTTGFIVEVVPIRFCPFCGQAVETYREK